MHEQACIAFSASGLQADFLPSACWWRLRLRPGPEPDRFLYVVTIGECKEEEKCQIACRHITWIEWKWFDGYDTILDAGLDTPNVAAMAQVYDNPNPFLDPVGTEYIDLLTDHQPTPAPWEMLTQPGERQHPEMHDFPPLQPAEALASNIESIPAAAEYMSKFAKRFDLSNMRFK